MRIYLKPFVDWIWMGAFLMALGGFLAVSDRRYRLALENPCGQDVRRRRSRRCGLTSGRAMMKTVRWSIPLALFVVLVAFLWVGLGKDPREVPSPLIDKPAPPFTLPQIQGDKPLVERRPQGASVWLLNVWASWCVSCRVEHPLLLQLAKAGTSFRSTGSTTRTSPTTLEHGSSQNGDPYTSSIVDQDGRVGIDYGVYGVPETFVIDRAGIVRYKQIGPLSVEALQEKILPLVRELQK